MTGRVQSRVPASVLGAFVLEGPGGRRLLVVPERSDVLPLVSEGLRASVRGRIVALEPSADDLGGDQVGDVVAIADLAARTERSGAAARRSRREAAEARPLSADRDSRGRDRDRGSRPPGVEAAQ